MEKQPAAWRGAYASTLSCSKSQLISVICYCINSRAELQASHTPGLVGPLARIGHKRNAGRFAAGPGCEAERIGPRVPAPPGAALGRIQVWRDHPNCLDAAPPPAIPLSAEAPFLCASMLQHRLTPVILLRSWCSSTSATTTRGAEPTGSTSQRAAGFRGASWASRWASLAMWDHEAVVCVVIRIRSQCKSAGPPRRCVPWKKRSAYHVCPG